MLLRMEFNCKSWRSKAVKQESSLSFSHVNPDSAPYIPYSPFQLTNLLAISIL